MDAFGLIHVKNRERVHTLNAGYFIIEGLVFRAVRDFTIVFEILNADVVSCHQIYLFLLVRGFDILSEVLIVLSAIRSLCALFSV